MNNWKDAVYLIQVTKEKKDQDGFPISEEKKSPLMSANFLGVTRAEEEHANQLGYKATLEVEIMSVNYNSEKILETEKGKRFRIRRAYPKTSEIIMLTCSDISKGK